VHGSGRLPLIACIAFTIWLAAVFFQSHFENEVSRRMGDRVNGFYYARWEGLYLERLWGHGVVFLKDGRVYGGDSQTCFTGEYQDHGDALIARVSVFSLSQAYSALLDEREENHQAVSLYLQRISLICAEEMI
jgi:hypothetical protein